MEQTDNQKSNKNNKKVNPDRNLRVTHSTQAKVQEILKIVNKKDLGRRIKADDVVAFAVGLLTEKHFETLKRESLSHHDRFTELYKSYCKANDEISENEFMGILLDQTKLKISTNREV